jgi:hypothetical protein
MRACCVSHGGGCFAWLKRRGAWQTARRCRWDSLTQQELDAQVAVDLILAPTPLPLLPDSAEYIVAHVTGTRFSLLNGVTAAHSTMAGVKAWEETLYLETKAALSSQKIRSGHPLISRMLDAPGQKLNSAQLEDEVCLTNEQHDALVMANVLAAHTNKTFTCTARHVVESFKALRGDAPAAAAVDR